MTSLVFLVDLLQNERSSRVEWYGTRFPGPRSAVGSAAPEWPSHEGSARFRDL
jgi:hypothetical protein